jgi:hypothetical protein
MFIEIFKSLALQMETIVLKITQPKLPKTKKELTKIYNELGISGNFSHCALVFEVDVFLWQCF